jgi:beta-lactamase superfamily II metal-dependent hydrolase
VICLTGNNVGSPPQYDEIEISVFGPGYGESVLIHLGQHEWMIVDSCVDPFSGQSAPIHYLQNLGVNPAETVKLVVATHWHDDHVRGIGNVFRVCDNAQFVCSAALRSQEFLTLVETASTRSMMTSSGVQEFAEIIDILRERRPKSVRPESVGPTFAVADRSLWQRRPPDGFPVTVHTLSPSDAAVTLAYHEISRLLPEVGQTKRRIVTQSPNLVAVVLWVCVSDATILLGSDLEETLNPGTGWSVIVDSLTRPSGTAGVFKIPHHSSVTADQPRVWAEMLQPEPVAILTPFVQGNVMLPTLADVNRICSRTAQAYTTSDAKLRKSRRRSGALEKTIRETVRNIRDAQAPIDLSSTELLKEINTLSAT